MAIGEEERGSRRSGDRALADAAASGQGTVVFCNSNIPWGGGEAWHLGAALSLARRGRRVLLVCHPGGELYERARHEGLLHIVPIPIGRLSFLNPVPRLELTSLFRKEKVEALIMNMPADLKVAGPAAKAAGVRHIVYRRGSALPVRDSFFNRYLYGTVVTRLIVNSRATKNQVLAANSRLIDEDRITILPNGIDIQNFDARLATARESRRGLPWQGKRPDIVIGNAGRLNVQKAQHILLRLGTMLERAGLDFGLVIAGSGEREEELKQLALSLGLGKRVLFTGFMEDMSPFWLDVDVFALSSLWEGFGYVLVEAMLAEKPVLAFAVSNIPELIRDGDNGYLFPLPEDEAAACPDYAGQSTGFRAGAPVGGEGLESMVKAIQGLAADPALRERMGRAGRVFAMRFSQDASMDALEALLR